MAGVHGSRCPGDGALHGARDVHDTGLRILDELRQVLTVVP